MVLVLTMQDILRVIAIHSEPEIAKVIAILFELDYESIRDEIILRWEPLRVCFLTHSGANVIQFIKKFKSSFGFLSIILDQLMFRKIGKLTDGYYPKELSEEFLHISLLESGIVVSWIQVANVIAKNKLDKNNGVLPSRYLSSITQKDLCYVVENVKSQCSKEFYYEFLLGLAAYLTFAPTGECHDKFIVTLLKEEYKFLEIVDKSDYDIVLKLSIKFFILNLL